MTTDVTILAIGRNSHRRATFKDTMQAQNGTTIAWLVAICLIAGLLAAVAPGL